MWAGELYCYLTDVDITHNNTYTLYIIIQHPVQLPNSAFLSLVIVVCDWGGQTEKLPSWNIPNIRYLLSTVRITPVSERQRVIREGEASLSPLLIKRHEKKMNNYIFRLRGLRRHRRRPGPGSGTHNKLRSSGCCQPLPGPGSAGLKLPVSRCLMSLSVSPACPLASLCPGRDITKLRKMFNEQNFVSSWTLSKGRDVGIFDAAQKTKKNLVWDYEK